jgi:hypothetical protein
MQGLATFIMRGRSQAALVASATAVLSLMVPMVGLLSSATVALVTMRQGPAEGLVVGLFAGLASGLLAFAALGSPLPAIGFALALWMPVWVLGLVLRNTRSLTMTIQLASLIGLVIVLGIRLGSGDPTAHWSEILEPIRENLVQGEILNEESSRELVSQVARWMTGAFAATFYLQALLALFLGRWWQSLLYNPGGFGVEFRELRLSRGIGVLSAALLLLLMIQGEAQWAADLLLLVTPLLFLQGLAVIHGLVNLLNAGRAWLFGLYAALVLIMPHAEILVAGLGLADIWMDVRAKVRARGKHGN